MIAFNARGVNGFRKNRLYRVWIAPDAIYFADLGEDSWESAGSAFKSLLVPGSGGLVGAVIKRERLKRAVAEIDSIQPDDLILDGKDQFRAARQDFEWTRIRHRGWKKVIEWMMEVRVVGRIRLEFPTKQDWEIAGPALREWFGQDFSGP